MQEQKQSLATSFNTNEEITVTPETLDFSMQYNSQAGQKVVVLPSSNEHEKHEKKMLKRQIERMIELKEQLLAIRERKSVIPKVPDPQIVDYFTILKQNKQSELAKRTLLQRIQQKKKELKKFKIVYAKSLQQYEEKSEIFREKSALQRVLAGKMQGELNKTKQRFREVQFNKVIVEGIRKVLYYRLAEILFNSATRNIFNIIQNLRISEQKLDEESIGNCLGYLGLFVSIIAAISGAKTWINFAFRGPKSTIRSNDGNTLILHPKESKLGDALKLLNEQLFQIMRDTMCLKVENSNNFYQLCQELSKQILTIR